MTAVVALDLSLVSTGWAYNEPPEECLSGTFPSGSRRGVVRLHWLRNEVDGLLHDDYDMLLIEELPPGTRGNSMHGVAELHGVIKMHLADHGHDQATYIAPASVKKYATGKGNADKMAMLSAAVQRLGYTGSSGDEVDALWLLAMGLDHLGTPLCTMPAVNRAALDKVVWP
jgi:Holliday junction resolvasome RuvABC endonuclease subunit